MAARQLTNIEVLETTARADVREQILASLETLSRFEDLRLAEQQRQLAEYKQRCIERLSLRRNETKELKDLVDIMQAEMEKIQAQRMLRIRSNAILAENMRQRRLMDPLRSLWPTLTQEQKEAMVTPWVAANQAHELVRRECLSRPVDACVLPQGASASGAGGEECKVWELPDGTNECRPTMTYAERGIDTSELVALLQGQLLTADDDAKDQSGWSAARIPYPGEGDIFNSFLDQAGFEVQTSRIPDSPFTQFKYRRT
jgi:hypothetical protein